MLEGEDIFQAAGNDLGEEKRESALKVAQTFHSNVVERIEECPCQVCRT